MELFIPEDSIQHGTPQEFRLALKLQGGTRMRTFMILGKSSSEELKEISLKYRAEIVSLVENFGGDVKSMYVMLKEKYLIFVLAFPGIKRATKASIVLSKLTGISFWILPVVPVDEFSKMMA